MKQDKEEKLKEEIENELRGMTKTELKRFEKSILENTKYRTNYVALLKAELKGREEANKEWVEKLRCNSKYNVGIEAGKEEARKEAVEDEIRWLESITENLLIGRRKRGQHKFNKVSVKERLSFLKPKLKVKTEIKLMQEAQKFGEEEARKEATSGKYALKLVKQGKEAGKQEIIDIIKRVLDDCRVDSSSLTWKELSFIFEEDFKKQKLEKKKC